METAQEKAVWKALGDPTRRRLLTLLRDGPKSTGTLCEAFEMSRYGVMKHLEVLVGAQLVLVRRQGRRRINHLNAAPIQRIHGRFVRRFAAQSASKLLRLEAHLGADSTEGNPAMNEENTNRNFHIVQELQLAASPERVWKSLTAEVGQWWGFHVGPNDSSITLDARVGGQFIERWGDGEGELYATATYVKKGVKITLEGGMGMAGPGYSKFSFTLEPSGETDTKVVLNHYCHGYRSEETETSYTEGWNELLGTHLKAWVEEGKVAEPS